MNSFQPWLKILGSQEYCSLKSLSTLSSFRATKSVLMSRSAKPRGTEFKSSSLSSDALCLLHVTSEAVSCVSRGSGQGHPSSLVTGGLLQMLRKE